MELRYDVLQRHTDADQPLFLMRVVPNHDGHRNQVSRHCGGVTNAHIAHSLAEAATTPQHLLHKVASGCIELVVHAPDSDVS